MSRGFHWRPASQPLDRVPLPWLANPRNPAMSPHARHPGTCHTDRQWKGEGRGEGRRPTKHSMRWRKGHMKPANHVTE